MNRKSPSKRIPLAEFLAAFSLVAACGGDTPEANNPPPPPEPAPVAAPPPPPPPAEPAPVAAPEPPPPPPAEPPLSDAQIAAVTAASHTAEIDAGKLAQTKAKDGRVKKFAAMMVSHHGDAKKKQDKLLTKEKLAPAESPVSAKVKSDSESAVASLKSATGVEFDKAYIDSQVKMHEDTLNALDTKLLPNVKHADLKAQLQEFRPKVEEHLKQAKELQTSLAAGPPAKKLARRRKGARGGRPVAAPAALRGRARAKMPHGRPQATLAPAGRGASRALPSHPNRPRRFGCCASAGMTYGWPGVVLSPA